MDPVIIVGSGLAGYTVAREFRKLDKTTELVVVTRDSGAFYSKPMLSNAYAQKKSAEQLVSQTGQAMAEQLDLTLLAHTEIHAIDTAAHEIDTSAGRRRYGKLVLALGADPIRLPLTGAAAGDVLSVNDLDDYARFRRLAAEARCVVVIGAGLIGCEFANDLIHAGVTPVVVDPNAYPLATLLPETAALAVRDALAAAGVEWKLRTTVAAVEHGDQGGYRVDFADGSTVAADAVLSAVGLRPRTALARAAGLTVGRGIAVDAFAATSAPDVYALGDCAEYDGTVLPYVLPIMTAARALAATLAGTATPYLFPVMPVSIKTPAHPVAVHPAPLGQAGAWQADHADSASGLKMLFKDADGCVKGFVLTGAQIRERAAVLRMMAASPDAPARSPL